MFFQAALSAVFWIQWDPLIPLILITHWCFCCCWAVVILSQELCSASCSASEDLWQETGREHWVAQCVQRDTPYHRMSCAQFVNWSSWLAGDNRCLGISQCVVSNSIVHHLSLFYFSSLSHLLLLFYCYWFSLFQLLISSYLRPCVFCDSPPSLTRVGVN